MPFFAYGDAEVAHIAARDPVLGQVMAEIGPIEREIIPDVYTALVQAILAQQISAPALKTIWDRTLARFGMPSQDGTIIITPQAIAAASVGEIQTLGTSMRKASYIADATLRILSGGLDLEALRSMSDQEVCEALTALRGVGVWTAEMLLIFSLQRPDVMSYRDLAIVRGLRMLHGIHEVTPAVFEEYRLRYSPHGTVASLYLWAIAGGAHNGLTDPARQGQGGSA